MRIRRNPYGCWWVSLPAARATSKFHALIKSDYVRWGKVVKEAGIRVQ
jgi:hypothetical protein